MVEERMGLYLTGCKHAGENLRSAGRPPIKQMSAALARHVPKIVETRIANGNAHGRRKFVQVTASFGRRGSHIVQ